MTAKTALIFATTAAIALASFEMRPARRRPRAGRAIVKQNAGAEDSARSASARGRGAAVPLARSARDRDDRRHRGGETAGASTTTSVPITAEPHYAPPTTYAQPAARMSVTMRPQPYAHTTAGARARAATRSSAGPSAAAAIHEPPARKPYGLE
jgi:hypothetical protein